MTGAWSPCSVRSVSSLISKMRPRHKPVSSCNVSRLICKKGHIPHGVYVCVYVLISPRKMRTGTRQWQVMHFTFNKLTLQCVRTYKQGVSSLEINGLQGEEQRPPPSPPLAALFHVPSNESLDTANPCLISRNCGIRGGGENTAHPSGFFSNSEQIKNWTVM